LVFTSPACGVGPSDFPALVARLVRRYRERQGDDINVVSIRHIERLGAAACVDAGDHLIRNSLAAFRHVATRQPSRKNSKRVHRDHSLRSGGGRQMEYAFCGQPLN